MKSPGIWQHFNMEAIPKTRSAFRKFAANLSQCLGCFVVQILAFLKVNFERIAPTNSRLLPRILLPISVKFVSVSQGRFQRGKVHSPALVT